MLMCCLSLRTHNAKGKMTAADKLHEGDESMNGPKNQTEAADGGSALTTELASTLPWHVGFHNQIADTLEPTGDWHPDMVRYSVVQVCDYDGRHVCWAKSSEHAAMKVIL